MRKLSLIIALFVATISFAQEKQFFEVKYQAKIDIDPEEVLKNVPAQYRSMMEAQIKQEIADGIFLDYVLKTNGQESSYKMVEKISNSQGQGGMLAQQMAQFDKGITYKDLAKKEYMKPVELPGIKYLLKDTLSDMHWQISREKENVAGFEVRKAEGSFEINNESIKTVAWFAPKIAIKDGPSSLWGLPGLILKAQFSINGIANGVDMTIYATEIEVKDENLKIEKPTGGKEVTQKEFMEEMKALQEKYKEMMGGGVDTE